MSNSRIEVSGSISLLTSQIELPPLTHPLPPRPPLMQHPLPPRPPPLYGAPGGPSVEVRVEATPGKRGREEAAATDDDDDRPAAKRMRQASSPATSAPALAADPAPVVPQSRATSQRIQPAEVIRDLEARVTILEATVLRLAAENVSLTRAVSVLTDVNGRLVDVGNNLKNFVIELKAQVDHNRNL